MSADSAVSARSPNTVVLFSSDPERAALTARWLLDGRIPEGDALILLAYGDRDGEVASACADLIPLDGYRLRAGPITERGISRALSSGIAAALSRHESSGAIVVIGDDARPVRTSWLAELAASLEPRAVADVLSADELRYPPELALPGLTGLAGPVSSQAQTIAQRAAIAAGTAIQPYADERYRRFEGVVSVAGLLDPFCWAIRASLAQTLTLGGMIDLLAPGETLPHALADLIHRAREIGFSAVVAEAVLVERSEPVPVRPVLPAPLADRLLRPEAVAETFAVIYAQFRSLRDLDLLRGSISRAADCCDAVGIVGLNNPLDLTDADDFKARPFAQLQPTDQQLLKECDKANEAAVARAIRGWAARVITSVQRPGRRSGIRVASRIESGRGDAVYEIVRSMQTLPGTETWILALRGDELIEDGVTYDGIVRLTRHPSAIVAGYDCAILTLWDSPRLVREDAPWGDGGSWRGGPSSVRLYRYDVRPLPRRGLVEGSSAAMAPLLAPDEVRVASVRLRRAGLLREIDRRGMPGGADAEDNMRVAAIGKSNRIGLHMLVYEREDPSDVARWLDEVYGLIDTAVLVWTSTEPVAPAFTDLASRYGATIVAHPLGEHLARARNAGIDLLRGEGLSWALFFDPDEWLADPHADARAIRRCAESTRWGWLLNVANLGEAGRAPTVSDSIRMSRLDPQGKMRMNGRVHEGFDLALQALLDEGISPRVLFFPFMLQHRGMALGRERTREKLAKYEALLRLELAENPTNPGAWVSLGWSYENSGHSAHARECLERAVACAGQSYLPFRELGIVHAREAIALFEAASARLSSAHPYAARCREVIALLTEAAPARLRRTGESETWNEPAPLPEFPGYALREEGG